MKKNLKSKISWHCPLKTMESFLKLQRLVCVIYFHLLADCKLLVFETKDNEQDKKERNKTFKEKTADPV
jgi:hypothetical protein